MCSAEPDGGGCLQGRDAFVVAIASSALGRAQLSYVVPRESHVRLTLLDVQGRELAVMADATFEAGLHAVTLDVDALRPGLHFVRMQAPGIDLRQRFVVLR